MIFLDSDGSVHCCMGEEFAHHQGERDAGEDNAEAVAPLLVARWFPC